MQLSNDLALSLAAVALVCQVACSSPTSTPATSTQSTSPNSPNTAANVASNSTAASSGPADGSANTQIGSFGSGNTGTSATETAALGSTGSGTTALPSSAATQLTGTWVQTTCASAGSGTSSKDTLIFASPSYTNNRQFYSDANCTTAVPPAGGGTLAVIGTFSLITTSAAPTDFNAQYAPAGTSYLAINITKIDSDYGNASIASSAASSYDSHGCPSVTASGSVVDLTTCLGNSSGTGLSYQFVLPNAADTSLAIGDASALANGCTSTAGAVGPCTAAQLTALGLSYQKQ